MMTYLEEFQTQINNRNFPKFLQLWEEYCTSDAVDAEEFLQLLRAVKHSDFAKPFGQLIETALPLWQSIKDKNSSYDVLKLLIDLETTNSPLLAETAYNALKEKYGEDAQFSDRMRLVGLRARDQFQGALANYDLLAHMQKGNFVFHTSGWGAGEIMELSPVRQQLSIEFENVGGRKHLTFDNAFKVLIPLSNDHFLVRRFADPDLLEKEARENPVAIIKLLLKDLGAKNAAEIKDELCELVIPEDDWTKWWQGARARLKKDQMIEPPATLRDPFRLRAAEISHEERLQQAIHQKTSVSDILLTSYNFVRDLPNVRKNQEVRNSIRDKLIAQLADPELTPEQELQICICLETQFSHEVEGKEGKNLIQSLKNPEAIINAIDIIALKKRALMLVREFREDWLQIFPQMLLSVKQSTLRDYLLKELNQGEQIPLLEKTLKTLLNNPASHPECFIWYFQKIVSNDSESLPFGGKEGICKFFDSLLMLLSILENKPEHRDLVKKIYNLLTGKRYAIVRSTIEGTSIEFVKEFLLLASKCQSFTDHDMKILRSLAEVVHPSLGKNKQQKHSANENTIWTTEEGFLRVQDQVRHIGTIEIVENAREIEAARALGDLRENSEYKFALEKRSRLQGQLKTLSDQLRHSRIITTEDIHPEEVSVGSIVDVADSQGKIIQYTILGPWDANPDEHILSFQSKLAQAMIGNKKGDTFEFRAETFTISSVRSFLEKSLEKS
jgi:transcription elongation factor GreA-like protein/transcription elongation GreA/GreB family factor